MEEVMKRQIRNAISSLMIAAIAGIGLMAFGQNPCGCPQPCVTQPVVQPVAVQPVVQETIQVVQPCPQPYSQGVSFAQPVAFGGPAAFVGGDPYELVKDIERNADDLRKYFRRSLDCLDCVSDDYYDSVKEFERATDQLRHDVKHEDCDVAASVNEVLRLAECISAYMDPCSLCPEVTEAWNCLRGDLQALAAQFCNTVAFQQPISLQPSCPVPAQFVQPVQPVQFVQPVQPVSCPAAPVAPVINYK
jgi:hypothetical protein